MLQKDKITIAISGHGGLIGTSMKRLFEESHILVINRRDFELSDQQFASKFENADVIMNFAGSPIIRRWTSRNRKEILLSRLKTTQKIGAICELGKIKKRKLINASAIGIYANEGKHTEKSMDFNKGFLYEVTSDWEKEALKLRNNDTKVIVLRIGVVLAKEGGMLKRLLPLFRRGLGGQIANGKQAFSWIHLHDLTNGVERILRTEEEGIFNMTAPEWTDNATFTRVISDILHVTARFRVPEWALKLRYGNAASTICQGQAVIPQRLINMGYAFNFPDLKSALEEIVN